MSLQAMAPAATRDGRASFPSVAPPTWERAARRAAAPLTLGATSTGTLPYTSRTAEATAGTSTSPAGTIAMTATPGSAEAPRRRCSNPTSAALPRLT